MPNQIELLILWFQTKYKEVQDAWALYQWYKKNKGEIDWWRGWWPF